MPDHEPTPATHFVSSDEPADTPTEAEQPVLKEAEDSGNDATGGAGIATGVAQA